MDLKPPLPSNPFATPNRKLSFNESAILDKQDLKSNYSSYASSPLFKNYKTSVDYVKQIMNLVQVLKWVFHNHKTRNTLEFFSDLRDYTNAKDTHQVAACKLFNGLRAVVQRTTLQALQTFKENTEIKEKRTSFSNQLLNAPFAKKRIQPIKKSPFEKSKGSELGKIKLIFNELRSERVSLSNISYQNVTAYLEFERAIRILSKIILTKQQGWKELVFGIYFMKPYIQELSQKKIFKKFKKQNIEKMKMVIQKVQEQGQKLNGTSTLIIEDDEDEFLQLRGKDNSIYSQFDETQVDPSPRRQVNNFLQRRNLLQKILNKRSLPLSVNNKELDKYVNLERSLMTLFRVVDRAVHRTLSQTMQEIHRKVGQKQAKQAILKNLLNQYIHRISQPLQRAFYTWLSKTSRIKRESEFFFKINRIMRKKANRSLRESFWLLRISNLDKRYQQAKIKDNSLLIKNLLLAIKKIIQSRERQSLYQIQKYCSFQKRKYDKLLVTLNTIYKQKLNHAFNKIITVHSHQSQKYQTAQSTLLAILIKKVYLKNLQLGFIKIKNHNNYSTNQSLNNTLNKIMQFLNQYRTKLLLYSLNNIKQHSSNKQYKSQSNKSAYKHFSFFIQNILKLKISQLQRAFFDSLKFLKNCQQNQQNGLKQLAKLFDSHQISDKKTAFSKIYISLRSALKQQNSQVSNQVKLNKLTDIIKKYLLIHQTTAFSKIRSHISHTKKLKYDAIRIINITSLNNIRRKLADGLTAIELKSQYIKNRNNITHQLCTAVQKILAIKNLTFKEKSFSLIRNYSALLKNREMSLKKLQQKINKKRFSYLKLSFNRIINYSEQKKLEKLRKQVQKHKQAALLSKLLLVLLQSNKKAAFYQLKQFAIHNLNQEVYLSNLLSILKPLFPLPQQQTNINLFIFKYQNQMLFENNRQKQECFKKLKSYNRYLKNMEQMRLAKFSQGLIILQNYMQQKSNMALAYSFNEISIYTFQKIFEREQKLYKMVQIFEKIRFYTVISSFQQLRYPFGNYMSQGLNKSLSQASLLDQIVRKVNEENKKFYTQEIANQLKDEGDRIVKIEQLQDQMENLQKQQLNQFQKYDQLSATLKDAFINQSGQFFSPRIKDNFQNYDTDNPSNFYSPNEKVGSQIFKSNEEDEDQIVSPDFEGNERNKRAKRYFNSNDELDSIKNGEGGDSNQQEQQEQAQDHFEDFSQVSNNSNQRNEKLKESGLTGDNENESDFDKLCRAGNKLSKFKEDQQMANSEDQNEHDNAKNIINLNDCQSDQDRGVSSDNSSDNENTKKKPFSSLGRGDNTSKSIYFNESQSQRRGSQFNSGEIPKIIISSEDKPDVSEILEYPKPSQNQHKQSLDSAQTHRTDKTGEFVNAENNQQQDAPEYQNQYQDYIKEDSPQNNLQQDKQAPLYQIANKSSSSEPYFGGYPNAFQVDKGNGSQNKNEDSIQLQNDNTNQYNPSAKNGQGSKDINGGGSNQSRVNQLRMQPPTPVSLIGIDNSLQLSYPNPQPSSDNKDQEPFGKPQLNYLTPSQIRQAMSVQSQQQQQDQQSQDYSRKPQLSVMTPEQIQSVFRRQMMNNTENNQQDTPNESQQDRDSETVYAPSQEIRANNRNNVNFTPSQVQGWLNQSQSASQSINPPAYNEQQQGDSINEREDQQVTVPNHQDKSRVNQLRQQPLTPVSLRGQFSVVDKNMFDPSTSQQNEQFEQNRGRPQLSVMTPEQIQQIMRGGQNNSLNVPESRQQNNQQNPTHTKNRSSLLSPKSATSLAIRLRLQQDPQNNNQATFTDEQQEQAIQFSPQNSQYLFSNNNLGENPQQMIDQLNEKMPLNQFMSNDWITPNTSNSQIPQNNYRFQELDVSDASNNVSQNQLPQQYLGGDDNIQEDKMQSQNQREQQQNGNQRVQQQNGNRKQNQSLSLFSKTSQQNQYHPSIFKSQNSLSVNNNNNNNSNKDSNSHFPSSLQNISLKQGESQQQHLYPSISELQPNENIQIFNKSNEQINPNQQDNEMTYQPHYQNNQREQQQLQQSPSHYNQDKMNQPNFRFQENTQNISSEVPLINNTSQIRDLQNIPQGNENNLYQEQQNNTYPESSNKIISNDLQNQRQSYPNQQELQNPFNERNNSAQLIDQQRQPNQFIQPQNQANQNRNLNEEQGRILQNDNMNSIPIEYQRNNNPNSSQNQNNRNNYQMNNNKPESQQYLHSQQSQNNRNNQYQMNSAQPSSLEDNNVQKNQNQNNRNNNQISNDQPQSFKDPSYYPNQNMRNNYQMSTNQPQSLDDNTVPKINLDDSPSKKFKLLSQRTISPSGAITPKVESNGMISFLPENQERPSQTLKRQASSNQPQIDSFQSQQSGFGQNNRNNQTGDKNENKNVNSSKQINNPFNSNPRLNYDYASNSQSQRQVEQVPPQYNNKNQSNRNINLQEQPQYDQTENYHNDDSHDIQDSQYQNLDPKKIINQQQQPQENQYIPEGQGNQRGQQLQRVGSNLNKQQPDFVNKQYQEQPNNNQYDSKPQRLNQSQRSQNENNNSSVKDNNFRNNYPEQINQFQEQNSLRDRPEYNSFEPINQNDYLIDQNEDYDDPLKRQKYQNQQNRQIDPNYNNQYPQNNQFIPQLQSKNDQYIPLKNDQEQQQYPNIINDEDQEKRQPQQYDARRNDNPLKQGNNHYNVQQTSNNDQNDLPIKQIDQLNQYPSNQQQVNYDYSNQQNKNEQVYLPHQQKAFPNEQNDSNSTFTPQKVNQYNQQRSIKTPQNYPIKSEIEQYDQPNYPNQQLNNYDRNYENQSNNTQQQYQPHQQKALAYNENDQNSSFTPQRVNQFNQSRQLNTPKNYPIQSQIEQQNSSNYDNPNQSQRNQPTLQMNKQQEYLPHQEKAQMQNQYDQNSTFTPQKSNEFNQKKELNAPSVYPIQSNINQTQDNSYPPNNQQIEYPSSQITSKIQNDDLQPNKNQFMFNQHPREMSQKLNNMQNPNISEQMISKQNINPQLEQYNQQLDNRSYQQQPSLQNYYQQSNPSNQNQNNAQNPNLSNQTVKNQNANTKSDQQEEWSDHRLNKQEPSTEQNYYQQSYPSNQYQNNFKNPELYDQKKVQPNVDSQVESQQQQLDNRTNQQLPQYDQNYNQQNYPSNQNQYGEDNNIRNQQQTPLDQSNNRFDQSPIQQQKSTQNTSQPSQVQETNFGSPFNLVSSQGKSQNFNPINQNYQLNNNANPNEKKVQQNVDSQVESQQQQLDNRTNQQLPQYDQNQNQQNYPSNQNQYGENNNIRRQQQAPLNQSNNRFDQSPIQQQKSTQNTSQPSQVQETNSGSPFNLVSSQAKPQNFNPVNQNYQLNNNANPNEKKIQPNVDSQVESQKQQLDNRTNQQLPQYDQNYNQQNYPSNQNQQEADNNIRYQPQTPLNQQNIKFDQSPIQQQKSTQNTSQPSQVQETNFGSPFNLVSSQAKSQNFNPANQNYLLNKNTNPNESQNNSTKEQQGQPEFSQNTFSQQNPNYTEVYPEKLNRNNQSNSRSYPNQSNDQIENPHQRQNDEYMDQNNYQKEPFEQNRPVQFEKLNNNQQFEKLKPINNDDHYDVRERDQTGTFEPFSESHLDQGNVKMTKNPKLMQSIDVSPINNQSDISTNRNGSSYLHKQLKDETNYLDSQRGQGGVQSQRNKLFSESELDKNDRSQFDSNRDCYNQNQEQYRNNNKLSVQTPVDVDEYRQQNSQTQPSIQQQQNQRDNRNSNNRMLNNQNKQQNEDDSSLQNPLIKDIIYNSENEDRVKVIPKQTLSIYQDNNTPRQMNQLLSSSNQKIPLVNDTTQSQNQNSEKAIQQMDKQSSLKSQQPLKQNSIPVNSIANKGQQETPQQLNQFNQQKNIEQPKKQQSVENPNQSQQQGRQQQQQRFQSNQSNNSEHIELPNQDKQKQQDQDNQTQDVYKINHNNQIYAQKPEPVLHQNSQNEQDIQSNDLIRNYVRDQSIESNQDDHNIQNLTDQKQYPINNNQRNKFVRQPSNQDQLPRQSSQKIINGNQPNNNNSKSDSNELSKSNRIPIEQQQRFTQQQPLNQYNNNLDSDQELGKQTKLSNQQQLPYEKQQSEKVGQRPFYNNQTSILNNDELPQIQSVKSPMRQDQPNIQQLNDSQRNQNHQIPQFYENKTNSPLNANMDQRRPLTSNQEKQNPIQFINPNSNQQFVSEDQADKQQIFPQSSQQPNERGKNLKQMLQPQVYEQSLNNQQLIPQTYNQDKQNPIQSINPNSNQQIVYQDQVDKQQIFPQSSQQPYERQTSLKQTLQPQIFEENLNNQQLMAQTQNNKNVNMRNPSTRQDNMQQYPYESEINHNEQKPQKKTSLSDNNDQYPQTPNLQKQNSKQSVYPNQNQNFVSQEQTQPQNSQNPNDRQTSQKQILQPQVFDNTLNNQYQMPQSQYNKNMNMTNPNTRQEQLNGQYPNHLDRNNGNSYPQEFDNSSNQFNGTMDQRPLSSHSQKLNSKQNISPNQNFVPQDQINKEQILPQTSQNQNGRQMNQKQMLQPQVFEDGLNNQQQIPQGQNNKNQNLGNSNIRQENIQYPNQSERNRNNQYPQQYENEINTSLNGNVDQNPYSSQFEKQNSKQSINPNQNQNFVSQEQNIPQNSYRPNERQTNLKQMLQPQVFDESLNNQYYIPQTQQNRNLNMRNSDIERQNSQQLIKQQPSYPRKMDEYSEEINQPKRMNQSHLINEKPSQQYQDGRQQQSQIQQPLHRQQPQNNLQQVNPLVQPQRQYQVERANTKPSQQFNLPTDNFTQQNQQQKESQVRQNPQIQKEVNIDQNLRQQHPQVYEDNQAKQEPIESRNDKNNQPQQQRINHPQQQKIQNQPNQQVQTFGQDRNPEILNKFFNQYPQRQEYGNNNQFKVNPQTHFNEQLENIKFNPSGIKTDTSNNTSLNLNNDSNNQQRINPHNNQNNFIQQLNDLDLQDPNVIDRLNEMASTYYENQNQASNPQALENNSVYSSSTHPANQPNRNRRSDQQNPNNIQQLKNKPSNMNMDLNHNDESPYIPSQQKNQRVNQDQDNLRKNDVYQTQTKDTSPIQSKQDQINKSNKDIPRNSNSQHQVRDQRVQDKSPQNANSNNQNSQLRNPNLQYDKERSNNPFTNEDTSNIQNQNQGQPIWNNDNKMNKQAGYPSSSINSSRLQQQPQSFTFNQSNPSQSHQTPLNTSNNQTWQDSKRSQNPSNNFQEQQNKNERRQQIIPQLHNDQVQSQNQPSQRRDQPNEQSDYHQNNNYDSDIQQNGIEYNDFIQGDPYSQEQNQSQQNNNRQSGYQPNSSSQSGSNVRPTPQRQKLDPQTLEDLSEIQSFLDSRRKDRPKPKSKLNVQILEDDPFSS